MLKEPPITVIPGVHDGLSAVLAEQAGHRVLLAGGYAVSASLLGMPDLGLIALNEMAGVDHRMAMVVNVPIIADIDTGYGERRNVVRAIREIESAGASGAQIEDQVFPKQAGLTEGRKVVPVHAMADKIRACADARLDADFVLVARTDARPLTEAIERSNAYHEAGHICSL